MILECMASQYCTIWDKIPRRCSCFGGRFGVPWDCKPKNLGERARKWRLPKVVRRGCRRIFQAQGAKSLLHWCKMGLHWCKTGFAWYKRLLGDLGSIGPKYFWPPLLTTWQFPHFRALSQILRFAKIGSRLSGADLQGHPSWTDPVSPKRQS